MTEERADAKEEIKRSVALVHCSHTLEKRRQITPWIPCHQHFHVHNLKAFVVCVSCHTQTCIKRRNAFRARLELVSFRRVFLAGKLSWVTNVGMRWAESSAIQTAHYIDSAVSPVSHWSATTAGDYAKLVDVSRFSTCAGGHDE